MNIVRLVGICAFLVIASGWDFAIGQEPNNTTNTNVNRELPNPTGITSTSLILNGYNSTTTFANADELTEYLTELGIKQFKQELDVYRRKGEQIQFQVPETTDTIEVPDGLFASEELGDIIDALDVLDRYDVVSNASLVTNNTQLKGMVRGYSRVLNRISKQIRARGGKFSSDIRLDIHVYGQIEDFTFTATSSTSNTEFVSDGDKGRLTLTSTTFIEVTPILPAGAILDPLVFQLKYKIQTEDDAVEVHGINRDNSSNPIWDDPFPNTIPLNEGMKERIESLGFEWKLYAKGEKISVTEFTFVNYNGKVRYFDQKPAKPVWVRMIFEKNAYDCFDMLFKNAPLKEEKLEGLGPPLYCLGRCENPMLINTGL